MSCCLIFLWKEYLWKKWLLNAFRLEYPGKCVAGNLKSILFHLFQLYWNLIFFSLQIFLSKDFFMVSYYFFFFLGSHIYVPTGFTCPSSRPFWVKPGQLNSWPLWYRFLVGRVLVEHCTLLSLIIIVIIILIIIIIAIIIMITTIMIIIVMIIIIILIKEAPVTLHGFQGGFHWLR